MRSERRRPEPVLLVLGASTAAGAAPEADLGDVEHTEGDGRLRAKGGVSAPTSPPFISDESHCDSPVRAGLALPQDHLGTGESQ